MGRDFSRRTVWFAANACEVVAVTARLTGYVLRVDHERLKLRLQLSFPWR